LEDGDSVKWSTQPVPGFGTTQADEENYFYAFFKDTSRKSFKDKNGVIHTVTNLLGKMQAPVSISRNIIAYTSWQANDPVVHYLNGDLNFTGTVKGYTSGGSQRGFPASLTNQLGLGEINDRYAPWGQAGAVAGNFDPNPYNMAFKDPLVVDSDAWNFPTNKVPSIGWLGRIHRGTPWQSVYLKSTNILAYNKGTVSGKIGRAHV